MRLARPRLVAAALAAAIGLGAGLGVAEDLDPAALFESAKASYGEKKYGKAMADLKLLLGEVAKRRAEELRALLPAAPSGWKAEEGDSTDFGGLGWLGAGMTIQRRYEKGESSVTAEMYVDSPLIGMMLMGMNPMMAQAAGHSIVKVKGRQALLELDAGSKSGTLTMALASNSAALKFSGQGVARADLDAFGNATDLDRLEKALQE